MKNLLPDFIVIIANLCPITVLIVTLISINVYPTSFQTLTQRSVKPVQVF